MKSLDKPKRKKHNPVAKAARPSPKSKKRASALSHTRTQLDK